MAMRKSFRTIGIEKQYQDKFDPGAKIISALFL